MSIFSSLTNSESSNDGKGELAKTVVVTEEPPPVGELQKNVTTDTGNSPINIRFVGKSGDAPRCISDGDAIYELPESGVQKRGFYYENAAQIIALFPQLYKIPTDKG